MGTRFVTSLVKGENSYKVGKEAAENAKKKLEGRHIDFSIIFVSAKYNYNDVIRGVREVTGNAPLIGCSSSGEFSEERVEKESVACALISSDTHKFFTGIGHGLKEDEIKCLKDASSKFPTPLKEYPYLSAMILIDVFSGKGEEAVLSALSALGPNVKFSGGAAGDDFRLKETFVFSNDEIAKNAVSLAFVNSKIPVAIGVKHGHFPISPPLTVTKSEGNIVYELNGKPALNVWKEYTRHNAKNLGIDVDNLSDSDASSYFVRYQAGLLTGADFKIRFPGGTPVDKGYINFSCAMPEGVVLRVMESPKDAQIASARKAAEVALDTMKSMKLAGAIIFDCGCRAMILGDDFSKAIDGIKDVIKDIPFIGFETYGEIAMEIGQLSGFHNTTTVVLLFPE